MGLEDGIRKRGFRKWYERELVRSHAHLVLTFVCAVGLMASFELHDRMAPWAVPLWNAAAIVLLALVGLWSLRRYLYLLQHAEAVANQAVCPRCQTYARFKLVPHPLPHTHEQVQVRCGKCEHEWGIFE
jgi:predicted Zn finger-like uncharacterized protein